MQVPINKRMMPQLRHWWQQMPSSRPETAEGKRRPSRGGHHPRPASEVLRTQTSPAPAKHEPSLAAKGAEPHLPLPATKGAVTPGWGSPRASDWPQAGLRRPSKAVAMTQPPATKPEHSKCQAMPLQMEALLSISTKDAEQAQDGAPRWLPLSVPPTSRRQLRRLPRA